MRRIFAYWDTLIAIAMAIFAFFCVKPDIFKDVVVELVAFFGVQAAAILPAMIFAAGILRPEGLTVTEVRGYRKALRAQMIFWIVLLVLDFLVVIALIFGKIISWSLPISWPHLSINFEAAKLLTALIVFLGITAILRMIPFLKGIMSLLFLNGEMTEKALVRKNANAAVVNLTETQTQPFKTPNDFGKTTDS